MKVIDLLNKIANGEEIPKKIRIDHWCYKFEWQENVKQYWDEENELSLDDALSLNKEELNYGIHEIKDKPKKIEKMKCWEIDDEPKEYGFMINENGMTIFPNKINKIEICSKKLLDAGIFGTKVNNNIKISNSINTLIQELQETNIKINEIIDYINEKENK